MSNSLRLQTVDRLGCEPPNILIRVIRKAPLPAETIWTPEFEKIAADAAHIRALVKEDEGERTKFKDGLRRSPFVGDFPRFELPYPKVKY